MRSKLTPALAGLALSVAAGGCAFPLAHHTAPSPAPPATRTETGRPTTGPSTNPPSASAPSAAEGGATAPAIPGAADLSTIPGHDLLPPCLPPGFALPEGTQIVDGVDSYGADGPCTTTGGSFRVEFSELPEDVIEFLRQAYAEPAWLKDYDQGETVKLMANDAATGPLPAWKLDFLDDPAHPNPALGTYGATFVVFTFHGQTEGQVSYLPPSSETAS